jgi:L-threonylcarbamoyladenylate synthase
MIQPDKLIQRASELLLKDKLVSFPTETVYGLGGNALSDTAVAAIYAAKGRPEFNPLIVHVHSLEAAKKYAQFTALAETLAQHFWPGPLTLVLKRRSDCPLSLLVSAGMDTVALRIPSHPIAQALLKKSGLPIAAPSANRSGRISPTEAAHVKDEMGDRVELILDGGACSVGIESTVVGFENDIPVVLRPGSISPEALSHIAGINVTYTSSNAIAAPGMLASHYAPNASVRLNATSVAGDEGLLAFGGNFPTGAATTLNLSPSGDLSEATVNLFKMLRALDASGVKKIAVMPIPESGENAALAVAINDRLQRAAAPR